MCSGGETIRDICRQSGAHVELSRDQNASSLERVFRISGLPDQMQNAIRLISEKAGIVSHVVTAAVCSVLAGSMAKYTEGPFCLAARQGFKKRDPG